MANPHYDPKNIGKTKAPAQSDPNEPYLKGLDQRNWSELSTKYERGDTALRAKVAKLAREVPELRPHLVPLLRMASQTKASKLLSRQEAILKKYLDGGGNAMDFEDLPTSVQKALSAVKDQETLDSDVNRWLGDNNNPHLKSKWASHAKVAHKPHLLSEGLTKEAVRDDRAFMAYKIDAEANNSKFYEGLIVQSGLGFAIIRRWGALTDNPNSRVDGVRFDDDPRFHFDTLNAAKMALKKVYSDRIAHGYKDAFGGSHTTPDGHKLPMGEYPVGLSRQPGFGWGSQSIVTCSPVLRDLVGALSEARSEILASGRSETIKDKLETTVTMLRTLARTDSTMAQKIAAAMSKVLRRLSGSPRFLPDPEGRALSLELQTIQRYVSKQMSLCS